MPRNGRARSTRSWPSTGSRFTSTRAWRGTERAKTLKISRTVSSRGFTSYGAGVVAARQAGAAEIVDPRPFAVGSIRATYDKYPNAAGILPAMGYGSDQIRELQETIRARPRTSL